MHAFVYYEFKEQDDYSLTELLDKLFVLVELLESLDVHVRQICSFSLVTVLLVSQDAHGELWPGQSLQPGRNNYLKTHYLHFTSNPREPAGSETDYQPINTIKRQM